MIALFCEATHQGERPHDFALSKAQYYPAYLSIYLIGFAVNQVDVGIMGWRHSKVAPGPWLRRGLRLVAFSTPFALIYSGCRAADIVAAQLGTTGHAWEPLAQCAVAGTVSKTVGWTMPDWGRYVSKAWEAVDRRVAYRSLTRLHQDLTAQVPDPVLGLHAGADFRTRLYRMMVEIRDAQWALRFWMFPEAANDARRRAEAAGLAGDALAASIEAAQLRAAIQAKQGGVMQTDNPYTERATEPQDLAAELAFQRQLAKAFRSMRVPAANRPSTQENPA
ncbi:hypothetical protein OG220_11450 [Streptomyces sp. NBC_01187]|nr:hypothetical protein OG220_11450 [Streptomyces sp. NBC_01187]